MKKKAAPPKKDSPNYSGHFTTTEVACAFSREILEMTGAVVDVIPDGSLHRVDDPFGKPGNLAIWYVCFCDDTPAGKFGNWRTGESWRWKFRFPDGTPMNISEKSWAKYTRAKIDRQEKQMKNQAKAQTRAKLMLADSKPASGFHPYLLKKKIPPMNLRILGSNLLVPLVDTLGRAWNLQTILPNGDKRFLKGGRVAGLFYPIDMAELPKTGKLYICEGVATAITLHLRTGEPVIAAMTAGNLKEVALEIGRAAPGIHLCIAADNDHRTSGNPGITKAEEAAREVGCEMIWPSVCSATCCCTDFNDLANCNKRGSD